jgi:hypothetical protein
MAQQAAAQRKTTTAAASEQPLRLAVLLRLGKVTGEVSRKGETESRHARIEAVEIGSEPDVYLPAWVFRPKTPPAKQLPTLVMLDSAGRNAQWNEDSLCQRLAARGVTVWAVDVRGIGDLRPEFPRESPNHARWHQDDEAYGWASLILSRPLIGQRVTDLLAVAEAIPGPKLLAARGTLAVPPAMFAAAVQPAFARVYAAGGPASYRSLLQQEDAGPVSNVLPDVLSHTDLPLLLGEGRVTRAEAAFFEERALLRFSGVE